MAEELEEEKKDLEAAGEIASFEGEEVEEVFLLLHFIPPFYFRVLR